MSQIQRITFNPEQCGGRPCIRGMRIRVKDVLDMLAAGATEAEILADFPYLEREDFRHPWNTRPRRWITRCWRCDEISDRRPIAADNGSLDFRR
jgi:uncharacterized protein (DUF433 family)